MIKGAIGLFAFLAFLLGCAVQVTYQPPPPPPPSQPAPLPQVEPSENPLTSEGTEQSQPEETNKEVEKEKAPEEEKTALLPEVRREPHRLLPNLAIRDLSLDSKRKLIAMIENRGDGLFHLGDGSVRVLVDGQIKGNFPLDQLSDASFLLPKESLIIVTPLTISGRHEVQAFLNAAPEMGELDRENSHLTRTLEGLPIGPDIAPTDLELTEDLDLLIILSNTGDVDLRKGITLRIRVFVNGQRLSTFDHFTSEALKAHFGSQYAISPPYGVRIEGISKVKVSVSATRPSDDVRLENNSLERTFIVFPFRIQPQGREKFTFFASHSRSKKSDLERKLKAEARWDGGGASILLSLRGPGKAKTAPILSGRSPLKLECLIPSEGQGKGQWKVSVANLIDKSVEGCVIVQFP